MRRETLNVIIIDNDVALHETYKSYFEHYPDFNLSALFTTIEAALSVQEDRSPDIIISEVDFNKMNGIEGIKFFRKQDPNVQILVASANNDFEIIKAAFKNGANGFLTKQLTAERLHQALLSIKNEGAALSNDVAKKIIATFQPKAYRSFSERENQIIDYLGQGATYKTIADKLFVTPSAVNFHIQNIYLKLNVNSKSEALMKLQEIE